MSLVGAALISGGVSLLGGIFGRKSQRKTDQANDRAAKEAAELARRNQLEDAAAMYERTRASAERGGFNPLTAVLTGGANSQVVGGGAAFAARTAPLASIGMITEGLKDLGSVWSGEAAQKQKRYDLEMDLAKIKLDQAKADLQASATLSAIAKAGPRMGKAANSDNVLEGGRETVSNPNIVHSDRTYVNPRTPDAEVGEARYGDVAQEITGIRNAGVDAVYNARLQRVSEQYGRAVADRIHDRFGSSSDQTLSEVIREETTGKPKRVRPQIRPLRNGPTYDELYGTGM